MAENLRFVETLDHSNFDKGIADSTAAVRKLAEDANLASKGIKQMFDTPAMQQAKASFQGVQKAVEDYTRAMSRDLPMKQQLRETQKAAMELEQIYRGLSDAEKQSAAGQELRGKIDMLINKGGQLKDVMADVQRSMQFKASDTATLTATVQGIQALTAAAQVAAGAMNMLGMEQDDAMKVQKNLMAVLSVANGLQTIQNLLQKESALMMGLSAARTAVLNTVMAAKVAMSKADTIATKGAAAAQVLFNQAVKANPIGVAITLVAAATAAILAFSRGSKEATESLNQLNQAYKDQASELSTNLVKLEMLKTQWESLTSDKEKEQWVRDNADAFKSLGFEVNNTADAERLLVKQTDEVVAAITMRAEAAALAAMAQKKMQQALEMREDAAKRRGNPSWQDELVSGLPGRGSARQEARKAADEMDDAADRLESEGKDYARQSANLQVSAANLAKSIGGISRKSGGGSGGRASGGGTSIRQIIQGTIEWYDAEINKLKQLADQTATTKEKRDELLAQAAEMERQKKFKFDSWQESITFDPVRIADQINESLPKLSSKIKPMVIPVTFEDPVAAAKAKSDQLLKNTEGLRTAAMAAAGAFRNLGNAVGGVAGNAINIAGTIAQAIATMIQGYATATAQAAEMGNPWAWVAFALAGLAEVTSIISSIHSLSGYAQGGIVGGTSYTGDRQYIRVNSGEMILNGQQQARLFNMINNGGAGGEVTFHIQGQQLVGVLNNYNSKMGKVR